MSKAEAKTKTGPVEVDNPSQDDALSNINEQLQNVQQEIKDVSEQINQAREQFLKTDNQFWAGEVQRLGTAQHDLREKEKVLEQRLNILLQQQQQPASGTPILPLYPPTLLYICTPFCNHPLTHPPFCCLVLRIAACMSAAGLCVRSLAGWYCSVLHGVR